MKHYFQLFTHTEFCYTKFGYYVQTYRFYNFYDNNENNENVKKIKTSGNFYFRFKLIKLSEIEFNFQYKEYKKNEDEKNI